MSIINSSDTLNTSQENTTYPLCSPIIKTTDWKLISDIITVLLILITIIIFIGNLLVILSIATVNKLRRISDQYIASLAIADLLVSLFVLPFAVIRQNLGYWPFQSIYLCQFYISADIFTCMASILNLCCISIDRYIAISYPLKYITRRNRRISFLMITIAWITPVIAILPPLIGINNEHIVGIGCCYITYNKGYRIYSSIIAYFFPLSMIIYVHLRIFYIIKTRSKIFKQYRHNPRKRSISHQIRKEDIKPSNNFRSIIHDIDSYYCRVVTELESSTLSYTCKSSEHDRRTDGTLSNSLVNDDKTHNDGSFIEMDFVSTPEPVDSNLKHLNTFQVPTTQYDIQGQLDNSDIINQSIEMLNYDVINLQVLKSGERAKHSIFEEHDGCKTKPQVSHIPKTSILTTRIQVHNNDNKPICIEKKQSKANVYWNHQHHHRHRHRREKSIFNKEKKSVRTVTIVVGCFIICWTPFFSFYLGEALCDCTFSEELYAIVTWLGYINSICNPFIYAFYNKEYTNAFMRIIHFKCYTDHYC